MVHLRPKVHQRGFKQPSDFIREPFQDLTCEAHSAQSVDLVETATFQELHGNGEIHMNTLAWAIRQVPAYHARNPTPDPLATAAPIPFSLALPSPPPTARYCILRARLSCPPPMPALSHAPARTFKLSCKTVASILHSLFLTHPCQYNYLP